MKMRFEHGFQERRQDSMTRRRTTSPSAMNLMTSDGSTCITTDSITLPKSHKMYDSSNPYHHQ